MWKRFWFYDRGLTAIFAAAFLSEAVWFLVILLGFNEAPANAPETYETYFQQNNWWPYPFFFLALAPALWLTWKPMLHAWGQLAETGVLQDPGGGKPDDRTVRQVLCAVGRKRGNAVLAALVIALFVNLADWAPSADVMTGTANLDQQLRLACKDPNPFVKWIFVEWAGDAETLCALPATQPYPGEGSEGIGPTPAQISFNAIMALQQLLIVFFAALAVMQLLLHTLLFAVFERLSVARTYSLCLMLNCRSPLNEFGLEHWNYALNNFYWAASPAMLGVFLSRAATPPEDYLPGQTLLGIAVPLSLIVPMVATIIARQMRLPVVWQKIKPDEPFTPEDYRRQQLWPLDRNWSSKLGIVLAFALAALSIGFELSELMSL